MRSYLFLKYWIMIFIMTSFCYKNNFFFCHSKNFYDICY
nr:MAG TPA: hypothetical protein [Caudoviricetes sp.]